jgi:hypothetical protein
MIRITTTTTIIKIAAPTAKITAWNGVLMKS